MILGEIILQALRLSAEHKLSWVKNQESYLCCFGVEAPTLLISRSPDEKVYSFKVLNAAGEIRGQTCQPRAELRQLYERAEADYARARDLETQEHDKAYLRYTLGVLKAF